jgi:hypothetical protein
MLHAETELTGLDMEIRYVDKIREKNHGFVRTHKGTRLIAGVPDLHDLVRLTKKP